MTIEVEERQTGRPKKTWWDCVRRDMESFGLFCEDVQDLRQRVGEDGRVNAVCTLENANPGVFFKPGFTGLTASKPGYPRTRV